VQIRENENGFKYGVARIPARQYLQRSPIFGFADGS